MASSSKIKCQKLVRNYRALSYKQRLMPLKVLQHLIARSTPGILQAWCAIRLFSRSREAGPKREYSTVWEEVARLSSRLWKGARAFQSPSTRLTTDRKSARLNSS